MIDLHSHILPGLDDGAPDLGVSIEMARLALDEGIQTISATPHVSFDYPLAPRAIAHAVGSLNVALSRLEVPLAVLPGAELALGKISEMKDMELRSLGLGGSRCLLVESPYAGATETLGKVLFDLQVRGFRPMLAHPERARAFQERPGEVRELVSRGVLCCVNAGSLDGSFGPRPLELAVEMIHDGMVHVVASDAHNVSARAPLLRRGFEAAEKRIPGIAEQIDYYTLAVPSALLAGQPLPARPAQLARRRSRWKRITGRG
ncbi:MAG: tyrosine-protein phosphatase [Thermoleophilaceae bacterium]